MEEFKISNGKTVVKGIDDNGRVRILEKYDNKYYKLLPNEYEEARELANSYLGNFTEGLKLGANQRLANINQAGNAISEGRYKTQLEREKRRDTDIRSLVRKAKYGEKKDIRDTAFTQEGYENLKKSNAENLDKINKKSKILKENITAHGGGLIGEGIGYLASDLTNPLSYLSAGAGTLPKAVLTGVVANAGIEALNNYGDTNKTTGEKIRDVALSGALGGVLGGGIYGVGKGLSKGKDWYKNRKTTNTTEDVPVANNNTPTEDIPVQSQQPRQQKQIQPQSKTLDSYLNANQSEDIASNIRRYLFDDEVSNNTLLNKADETTTNPLWDNSYIDNINTEQQADDIINNSWIDDVRLQAERGNLLNVLNQGARAKRQAELNEAFANPVNTEINNVPQAMNKTADEIVNKTDELNTIIDDPIKDMVASKTDDLDSRIEIQLDNYNKELRDRLSKATGYHHQYKRQVANNEIRNPKAQELKDKITSEMTEPRYIDYNGVRYDIFTRQPIDNVANDVPVATTQKDEVNSIYLPADEMRESAIASSDSVNVNQSTDILNNNISDEVINTPVNADELEFNKDLLFSVGVEDYNVDTGAIKLIGTQPKNITNELKRLGFKYDKRGYYVPPINNETATKEFIQSLITKQENFKNIPFLEKMKHTEERYNFNFIKNINNLKQLTKKEKEFLKDPNNIIEEGDTNLADIKNNIDITLKYKGICIFEDNDIAYNYEGSPDINYTAVIIGKEEGKNIKGIMKEYELYEADLTTDEISDNVFNTAEYYISKAEERIKLNNANNKLFLEMEIEFQGINAFTENKKKIDALQKHGKNTTARGLVGFGGGVGSEAYEAHEEDRDFSWGNAFVKGLMGMGISHTGGGMITRAVSDTPLEKIPQKISGTRFIRYIRGKLHQAYKSDIGNRFFNSRLSEKKDYLKLRDDWQKSQDKITSKLEVVYRALNEHLTVKEKSDLHNLLVGEPVENISDTVVGLAKSFRQEINKLSKELVDLGILNKKTHEEWGDIYLHRTYQKNMIKSLRRTFSGGKNIHPIHQRGKEWKGKEDEFLRYLENDELGRLSEGKISAERLENGEYRFRRDWTKEERVKMGEITDGSFTVVETFKHLYDMRNAGRFLKNIKEQTNYMTRSKINDDIMLSGRKWGAMQGFYVPREIAVDLKNQYNSIFGHEDTIRRLWNMYLNALKKAWVVYNPVSHVNNVMSNIGFMVASGVPPLKAFTLVSKVFTVPHKISSLKKLQAKQIGNKMTDDDLIKYNQLMADDDIKFYLEADEAGAFGGNKLQEMLYNHGIAKEETKNLAVKGYRKINNFLENAYQAEDDIARLVFYKHIRSLGKTPQEAVDGVRSIIPDYRRPMSQVFSALRNTGFTPFISWTYHVFPTIMKQMAGMLQPHKANEFGTGIWRNRMLSSVVGILGIFGIAQALATATGAPSVLNGAVNPFLNNNGIPHNWGRRIYMPLGDNGDIYGLKVDRWSPHFDFLPQNLPSTLKNYALGGIPFKAGLMLNNYDPYYNTPITYRKGLDGLLDKVEYGVRNFAPVPKWAWNIYDIGKNALSEPKDNRRYYNDRGFLESLLNGIGFNIRSYNQDRFENEMRRGY